MIFPEGFSPREISKNLAKTLPIFYQDFPRFLRLFAILRRLGFYSKFCWLLCVLGILFLQNSLNFLIRFINHINLFGISRHFCYFKVRRSHGTARVMEYILSRFCISWQHACTRVAMKYKIYSMAHAVYAWDWVRCSEKSHCHVVQIGFLDFRLDILNLRYNIV